MNKLIQARNTALDLMTRALELLDGIGEDEAATDLQQAIDTLNGAHEPKTCEESEAALETPEVRIILERMDRRANMRCQVCATIPAANSLGV
ncbi:hypothetical protein [Sphingomonas sp. Leaf242]|uniref:hypothetical protein n=1 Tax=Sphingomonas sp. Leaf242 TaxID=1736304 RepID=UPI000714E70D|nr:hypothetical protein [Sphingomonas sp. Leaf242]KQO07854.1 hypothetical protein ASF09_07790 [Sphingomonas sp. Leaf242]